MYFNVKEVSNFNAIQHRTTKKMLVEIQMNQQLKTHFSKFSDELVWEYYGENRSFHKFNNKSLNIYVQIDRQIDRQKKETKKRNKRKETNKENKRKQKKTK